MTTHVRFLRRATAAVAALVLATALVACGNDDGDDPPVDPSNGDTTVAPADPADEPDDGDTAGAPADPGDAAVPPGFPETLPMPSGATRTQELAPGSYITFVLQSPSAVIDEFEELLPAAGWTIVERVPDVAARGDLMFTVERDGAEATILVQPSEDSEDESSVLWEVPS